MSAQPHDLLTTAARSLDRRVRMLRTAMGPLIAAALEDPDVVEILLNPDGSLWIDRLSSGRTPTDVRLSAADGERIIRLVGNYGEVFERNLGSGSRLAIARGVNNLWNKGGIQYAPPIR